MMDMQTRHSLLPKHITFQAQGFRMASAAYAPVDVVASPAEGDIELAVVAAEVNDVETKDDIVAKTLDDQPDDNKKEQANQGFSLSSIISRFGFSAEEIEPGYTIPEMSYWKLFVVFLWFGARAFGGPAAQIAMMKQELVTEQKWISQTRFNKVYAVYQVLPGPEATELACYFGYIAKGRIGALLGGLGFVLPGFLGMLLWSYIYVEFGLDSPTIQRSFRAVQSCVAAMIFRATYKLAEGALRVKGNFNWDRGFIFMFCFLTSVINLNFFIALAVSGIMNDVFENERIPYRQYVSYFIAACTIGFFVLYVETQGQPSGSLMGGSNASSGYTGTSFSQLFVLGLIAGCVTFGGAYTTLPFIYSAAVTSGGWLSQRAFLDAIAITNMMPTPLVTFVTLVGWVGHGVGGSILMTIGIFLPAFSFTVIGHKFFQAFVDNKFVEPFLEGVSAAVIGLLIFTAFQFVKSVITEAIDAVVFGLAYWALFHFTDRYTQPLVLLLGALAGQALF